MERTGEEDVEGVKQSDEDDVHDVLRAHFCFYRRQDFGKESKE